MIVSGIVNPAINSLLSRVRHTNTLIITDRGFPTLQGTETIDISLMEDIPRVLDVLRGVRLNFHCGKGYMAAEFRNHCSRETLECYENGLVGIAMTWEPHVELKVRARNVLGVIRTGDTTRYGNLLLESS
jgi:D-ribose pyranase